MRRLVLLLLLLLFAPPVLADVCPVAESVPHELIVKMHGWAPDMSLRGVSILHHFASGAELWRIEGDASEMIKSLRLTMGVEYAEPDYIVWADVIPNDPRWGTNGTYGLTKIDAENAWTATTGDPNGIVGIVDTGSGPHPDLDGNLIPGYDFINNDSDPSDDNRHGTFTGCEIGCVGDNGIGFTGVAWHVKLKPYKFLGGCGSGTSSNAIRAIDDATATGVPILSNSWGGGNFSQALFDSINAYCVAGGLFVASAGNNGGTSLADNDVTPQYPASYDAPCIISVAATDSLDGLAGFSSYGLTRVHLGAPGVSLLSGIPYPYTCSGPTLADYGLLSGTSMSAPLVAGVAHLVRSVCPACTGMDLKARILASVDPVASLAGKTVTGGRLNAARAVGAVVPPVAPACGDGTCGEGENCKNCELSPTHPLGDCWRIRKPRSDQTCCRDGRIQPGDLTRCNGDN